MPNSVAKLKPGVVPHIFNCQKDRKRAHTVPPRSTFLKRKRLALVEDAMITVKKEYSSDDELKSSNDELKTTEDDIDIKIEEHSLDIKDFDIVLPEKCDKGVQVNLKPNMESKQTQCNFRRVSKKARNAKSNI